MIRWEQGRAEIDELLRQAQLQRVPANPALAEHYLALGRDHLVAADMVKYVDTPGAFALTYDAARLALGALLIVQGLRARGEGAHVTVLQAVLAQCEPPRQSEFREFAWMRRLRNDTVYPDFSRAMATRDDVEQALHASTQIIARAEVLVGVMPPY
jgi:hypothetical protein